MFLFVISVTCKIYGVYYRKRFWGGDGKDRKWHWLNEMWCWFLKNKNIRILIVWRFLLYRVWEVPIIFRIWYMSLLSKNHEWIGEIDFFQARQIGEVTSKKLPPLVEEDAVSSHHSEKSSLFWVSLNQKLKKKLWNRQDAVANGRMMTMSIDVRFLMVCLIISWISTKTWRVRRNCEIPLSVSITLRIFPTRSSCYVYSFWILS